MKGNGRAQAGGEGYFLNEEICTLAENTGQFFGSLSNRSHRHH